MRLTGGEGKGRKLADPPNGVRPTSGRAKELLFQLIRDRIYDAHVLDVFAGTGALGIESLARGASKAVFIEKDRKVVKIISDNLRKCRFEDRSTIISGDALKKLKQGGKLSAPFDLIFIDPPYAQEVFTQLLETIAEENILAENGLLIFEASSRLDLEIPKEWQLDDERKLGDTKLLFLLLSE